MEKVPFSTFVNCEGPSTQPLLTFRYCVYAITSHSKTNEEVAEVVAVAGCYLIITHIKIRNH